MACEDYQIRADDGSRFCDRHLDENGEVILEGPNGKRMSVTSLIKQAFNPAEANRRRCRK